MLQLLTQLSSDAVDRPIMAFILVLAVSSVLAGCWTLIQTAREGLGAKVTSPDDLHQDQYTGERRAELRRIQNKPRTRRRA